MFPAIQLKIHLQELERIAADNHRLHKALNRIKPTVPSVKEVVIRTKDLERWYKNGCKLPDVLYETNSNSAVAGTVLPPIVSPVRQSHRSLAQREYEVNTGTTMNGGSYVKSMIPTSMPVSKVVRGVGVNSTASSEFDSSKSLMARLRPEMLSEVCDIKQPPGPLRQLLQAACAALGEWLSSGFKRRL
jgi:hypothetical protein